MRAPVMMFARHARAMATRSFAVALFMGSACSALAQSGQPQGARVALVIGQADYLGAPLASAVPDAALIASNLGEAGFEVDSAADLPEFGISERVGLFIEKLNLRGEDTTALVYISGRFAQINGENVLLPIGARIDRASDAILNGFNLRKLINALQNVPVKSRVIILDAGGAPAALTKEKTFSPGLALIEPPPGFVLSYSQSPNKQLIDPPDRTGYYSKAFLEAMQQPTSSFSDVFRRVRLRVFEETGGAQQPWESDQLLTKEFAFFALQDGATPSVNLLPEAPVVAQIKALSRDEAYKQVIALDTIGSYQSFVEAFPEDEAAPTIQYNLAIRREAEIWARATRTDTPDAYWTYVTAYPDGGNVAVARQRVADLGYSSASPPVGFAPLVYSDLPPPPARQGDHRVEREHAFRIHAARAEHEIAGHASGGGRRSDRGRRRHRSSVFLERARARPTHRKHWPHAALMGCVGALVLLRRGDCSLRPTIDAVGPGAGRTTVGARWGCADGAAVRAKRAPTRRAVPLIAAPSGPVRAAAWDDVRAIAGTGRCGRPSVDRTGRRGLSTGGRRRRACGASHWRPPIRPASASGAAAGREVGPHGYGARRAGSARRFAPTRRERRAGASSRPADPATGGRTSANAAAATADAANATGAADATHAANAAHTADADTPATAAGRKVQAGDQMLKAMKEIGKECQMRSIDEMRRDQQRRTRRLMQANLLVLLMAASSAQGQTADQVTPGPDTKVGTHLSAQKADAKSVDLQRDWRSFLAESGLKEGQNEPRSPQQQPFQIFSGMVDVKSPPNSPDWLIERANAHQQAILQAKGKYADFIAAEVKAGRSSNLFKADGQGVPSMGQNVAQKLSAMDKMRVLADKTLDEQIKQFDPGWDGSGKSEAQRQERVVTMRRQYEEQIQASAQAFTVGAAPIYTAEGPTRNGYAVLVGIVISENMRKIARAIVDPSLKLAADDPDLPIAAQLAQRAKTDPLFLTSTEGVRVMTDEKGQKTLVCFAGVPESGDSMITQKEAQLSCQGRIAQFVAEQVVTDSRRSGGQAVDALAPVQPGAKPDSAVSFNQKMNASITAETGKVSMAGLTQIETFDLQHPYSNQDLMVAVYAWSQDSQASALKLRQENNQIRREMETAGQRPNLAAPGVGGASNAPAAPPVNRGLTTNPSKF